LQAEQAVATALGERSESVKLSEAFKTVLFVRSFFAG